MTVDIGEAHAARTRPAGSAREGFETLVTNTRRAFAVFRRHLWHRKELRIYALDAPRIARLPRPTSCARDRWSDLQRCTAWSYANLTRSQYLAIAAERRSTGGQHLYSLLEEGELLHYGWLMSRQERAPDPALGLVFVPPAGSAALWDYFTHPTARGRGLYRQTLWQCLHDAVEIDHADRVFIYVYADNVISRHVIERAGFEYLGSMVSETRLFRTQRFGLVQGTTLDIRLLADDSPARLASASPARK